jgi:uncharacterized repeat protein (TIGR03943 family)
MARFVRVGLLVAWAGLFWYLLLTGRWSLFLAERVQWIVPVAAAAFTIAGVGAALSRSDESERLTSRQSWGFALGVAPVFLILLVPLGTLSSFAASRRTDFTSARFSTSAPLEPGAALSFQRLAGAAATEQGRAMLVQRQGEPVSLIGLVMAPREDGFDLTRFVVSCCVVDAAVARVPVLATGSQAEGVWVEVDGRLTVDAGGEPAVQASSVTRVEPPDPPYLSPSAD